MYNEQLTMIEREVILQPIVSVANLSKTYASGFQALKNINLDIRRGESREAPPFSASAQ